MDRNRRGCFAAACRRLLGRAGVPASLAAQVALLARLERVAFESAHQVLVPDGMGGFIHIDHLLLTPRGVLVLDTRRVAGLIFGGDQMSDWTVMGRGRRYTFDNPQPALYDRIAAVKAMVGDVPVEGRLLFSNAGKFTKGIPKWVLMLDGIEVEFPVVDAGMKSSPEFAGFADAWSRLLTQLAAEPASLHQPLSRPRSIACRCCGQGRSDGLGRLESEESDCVAGGRGRDRLEGFAAQVRNGARNMGQVDRFVTPRFRTRDEIARQKIRSVRFHHQPIERNVRDGCLAGLAAPLVAHPTRDADVKIEREIVLQFRSPAGKAMRNAAGEAAAKIREDGGKVVMRVALMEKHRLARRNGEFQLRDEGGALGLGRREIAEIIQAAFADRDHLAARRSSWHRASRSDASKPCGVMRMHAGGAP